MAAVEEVVLLVMGAFPMGKMSTHASAPCTKLAH